MRMIKQTILGLIVLGVFSGVLVGGVWLATTQPLVAFILLALGVSWMIGELLCA
jgi:hypothetical protein